MASVVMGLSRAWGLFGGGDKKLNAGMRVVWKFQFLTCAVALCEGVAPRCLFISWGK